MRPSSKRLALALLREKHGRKAKNRYLGWDAIECSHKYSNKPKNSKKKTLRTHRTGK